MFRRLAAVPAALMLLVLTASLALGATVTLHQDTPIDWNDPSVEVECDPERAAVPSGMVEWHFVVKATHDDYTLDLEFGDSSYDVTGLTWEKSVDDYLMHFYYTTTLTSLESATATGSGTVQQFNLSHVCPNPGEEIPEAPMSVLLIASAAVLGGGFLLLKRREGTAIA